jgi:hypothetical protein
MVHQDRRKNDQQVNFVEGRVVQELGTLIE